MKWVCSLEVTGTNQYTEICIQPILYFSKEILKFHTDLCNKSHTEIILKVLWFEHRNQWKCTTQKAYFRHIYQKKDGLCHCHSHIFYDLCPFEVGFFSFHVILYLRHPLSYDVSAKEYTYSTQGRNWHTWFSLNI